MWEGRLLLSADAAAAVATSKRAGLDRQQMVASRPHIELDKRSVIQTLYYIAIDMKILHQPHMTERIFCILLEISLENYLSCQTINNLFAPRIIQIRRKAVQVTSCYYHVFPKTF